MERVKFIFVVIVGLAFLPGCATPMVANLDKHHEHFDSTNDPNKGLIYIYREGRYFASMRGIYVDVNGKRVGALNSGTYFVYQTDPGEVVVSLENRLKKVEVPSVTMNVESGKTYYVRSSLRLGMWDADPHIVQVGESQGRTEIQPLTYATMKAKDLK